MSVWETYPLSAIPTGSLRYEAEAARKQAEIYRRAAVFEDAEADAYEAEIARREEVARGLRPEHP